MRISFEADFMKGSGAIRWEGATIRRLRQLVVSIATAVLFVTLLLAGRSW